MYSTRSGGREDNHTRHSYSKKEGKPEAHSVTKLNLGPLALAQWNKSTDTKQGVQVTSAHKAQTLQWLSGKFFFFHSKIVYFSLFYYGTCQAHTKKEELANSLHRPTTQLQQ